MTDHVTARLGAYHDGELSGASLHQVEEHLAECAFCRAELVEIQNLSALLQAAPSDKDLLPTETFVANLALRLPPQSGANKSRAVLEYGWWLIPVGLLAVGLFINITFTLSTVISFTGGAGLLAGVAGFQGNPFQMSWFSTAVYLFGNQLGAAGWDVLSALNDANVVFARLAWRLIPQAIVAVSYLGWLFSWWLRRRPQPTQDLVNLPRS